MTYRNASRNFTQEIEVQLTLSSDAEFGGNLEFSSDQCSLNKIFSSGTEGHATDGNCPGISSQLSLSTCTYSVHFTFYSISLLTLARA